MSIEVKLEDEDRKFLKDIKFWWTEAKKQLMWMTVAIVVGFGLGKIYTWDTLIADCKVLGVFRIANTAFQCKMMVP